MSTRTMSARGIAVSLASALVACVLTAPAASAAPAAPRLELPAQDARLEAVPAFSWKGVRGAATYEFQLSADANFGSIVLGQGRGSFQTRNTTATIDKSIPDGTYHWRVRAIDSRKRAGKWSLKREWVKSWSTRPELISPVGDQQLTHPLSPIVLRWTPVRRAYKYRVFIATDPSLSSLVISDKGQPVETSGTVFSPGSMLAPGRYHWAVQPVDAAGHRGAMSYAGSFHWSWPSATAGEVTDLVADARLADPFLSWSPVPGAVRYEVEISDSEDFAVGSKICCSEVITGTSVSPKRTLPSNRFHWRVRPYDADGNPGVWTVGPPFTKNFGDSAPTIPNLRLRDNLGDVATNPDAPVTTKTPLVTWDPVPGASRYEVRMVPVESGSCNWTTSTGSEKWEVETATTAFSPLAYSWNGVRPGWKDFMSPSFDGGKVMVTGHDYCVRVRARTTGRDARADVDISTDWSHLVTDRGPAFRFGGYETWDRAGVLEVPSSDYLQPVPQGSGALTAVTHAPYYAWRPVQGARSYWVVVAKDNTFENLVDVGLTNIPVYAPRANRLPRTYSDETTPLHWAVLPAHKGNGEGVSLAPELGNFQRFIKQSRPPEQLTPDNGADVSVQPAFRWNGTEGAEEYRLQVAKDAGFGDLVEDVATQSTAYTAAIWYPADTVLYWRVRAVDDQGRGLTWSPTRTFRRRLSAPALFTDNPLGGSVIPALQWHHVQGASSYDMHVDQSDGTRKDFNLRSTAFTPTVFYGTGVWRWQVRANFPGGGTQKVSSGYTGLVPYARRINAPEGARAVSSAGRLLVAWEPSTMVKEYRVQLSATNSFSRVAEDKKTQNLAFAPDLTKADFVDGGTLYWRVAAVDEGGNVGAWSTGQFRTARRTVVRVSGGLSRSRRGVVRVTVTDPSGSVVRNAKVAVTGAARAKARKTGKRGTATFSLRAKRRGIVTFRVTQRGRQPGIATVVVR